MFFSPTSLLPANPVGVNIKTDPEFSRVANHLLPSFWSDTFVQMLTIAQETGPTHHSSALVSSVCFQHSSQTGPVEWIRRSRHFSVQNPVSSPISSQTLPDVHRHTTLTSMRGVLRISDPWPSLLPASLGWLFLLLRWPFLTSCSQLPHFLKLLLQSHLLKTVTSWHTSLWYFTPPSLVLLVSYYHLLPSNITYLFLFKFIYRLYFPIWNKLIRIDRGVVSYGYWASPSIWTKACHRVQAQLTRNQQRVVESQHSENTSLVFWSIGLIF